MDDRWLPVEEIAESRGVGNDGVYTWSSSKRSRGHSVGRFWKSSDDEVDEGVRGGVAARSCNGAGLEGKH
jgi:hypothetical protein